jgi:hypothetical protein
VNISQIWTSATEAVELLAMYPFTWLCVIVIFLVVVEGLMLIPFVGFLVKLMVASLVTAQIVAMFAAAAAGTAPTFSALLSAFSWPVSTQLVLFFSALAPFALGLAYLYLKAGGSAVEFFFGNVLTTRPPEKSLFLQFKLLLSILALPFFFLPGAIVIKGLTGWAALAAAATAAITNWVAVLALLLMTLGLELATIQLPILLPKAVGGALAVLLLVAFLVWSFAFTYTLSKRAFPQAHHATVPTAA